MAITRTPDRYKGFIFDGIDSRDYGIYITDGSVFGAPERDVEMIEIPGRNGAFALDKGRFSNIEVEYSVGLYFDNETDFATAINSLRSELCSRKGYCRLEDDVHPDEYRMAVYKSGLDVNTNLRSSDFKIVFDCQPQRYLKSGEAALEVSSGDTINNPTLFDASPILKVYGYGDIVLGDGGTVSVSDDVIVGNTVLANGGQVGLTYTESIVIGSDKFMTGDIITLAPTSISVHFGTTANVTSVSASVASGYSVDASATKINSRTVAASVAWGEETFTFGTSKNLSSTVDVTVVTSGGNVVVQIPATISYNASTRTITRTLQTPTATSGTISGLRGYSILGSITGYSTAPAYTEPLYFDLSVGEAYAIEGGVPVSINGAVSFGVDLPVLPPGTSTITYDNTIDGLEIIPRWWEV